jgi:manganese/zinc/iron transport system substrate-binding protein
MYVLRIIRRSFLILCASLGVLGCQSDNFDSDKPLAERQIRVVTTTTMITDLVRVVGGDRVRVDGLMGAGLDPHTYKSSAGDLARLARADVIFYNGLHLEGQMGEVFETMQGRVMTVAVTDVLDPKRELRPAPEGFEGTHDPHVWFDVALWIKVAGGVGETLAKLDPTHADGYRERTTTYQRELAALDDEVRASLAKIPSDHRILVTAHDAFYYFGHAYGFEVRGLQGVSTATEAGAKDRRDLARFIAERKVPAIFLETSVPDRNIESVIETVERDSKWKVRLGGKLYSDALGDPDTPAGTYVGMVRHNVATIVKALAGE